MPFFKKLTEGDRINGTIHKLARNTIKWAVKNLKDTYRDDWDYIIQRELNRQFVIDTYKDLCLLTTKELNLEKRVINEISNVYLDPAERSAVITPEVKEDKKKEIKAAEEVVDDTYQEILDTSQINIVSKQWNRYTNLTNNVLVRPTWRDQKIEYDLHMFDNAEIMTDDEDWKKIIAIKYYVGLELPFHDNTVDEKTGAVSQFNDVTQPKGTSNSYYEDYQFSYLWTLEDKDKETGIYRKSFIYKYKKSGDEEEMVTMDENPYKDLDGNPILPFVLFSKTYPVDRLLDFTTGADLFDLNISTAINLVHFNALIKYTAWKQKWIITDNAGDIPNGLNLAPQKIAVLQKRNDKSIETGVWDQESDLDSFLKNIINRVKIVLAQYGLDVESFERSGVPESGFKLKVRKEGLMEIRKDQIELYREYEKQLFEVTRIVNNEHNNKKINPKAEFKIDFADPKFETDAASTNNNWTVKIANNIKTPIDWIMAENPDLTEDEAKVEFEKNKAVNGENVGNIPIKPLTNNKPFTNNGGNNAPKNTQNNRR